MANSIFQPILNEVSIRPFISPGVQDLSAAKAIAGMGEMAIEAWKGYTTAGLEEEQAQAMAAYAGVQQIGGAEEAVKQQFAQKQTVQDMWSNFDTPITAETMGPVNEAEKNLRNINERLIKAKEQGVFTASQLNTRMMANLREAVNRTPGFRNELTQATKNMLEGTELGDYVRGKVDAEVDQRKQMNDIYVSAIKEAEVDPNDFGGNIHAAGRYATKILADRKRVSDGLSQMEMLLKTNQLQQLQADQIVTSPDFQSSQQIAVGLLQSTLKNNISNQAYLLNKPAGMSDVDVQVTGIQSDVEKQRSIARGLLGKVSSGGRPIVEGYIKQLDNMEATYLKIVQGDFTAEQRKNMLTSAEAVAKLPYVNESVRLDQLNKLSSSLEHVQKATGTMMPLNKDIISALTNYSQNQIAYLMGGGQPPLASVNVDTKPGQLAMATALAFVNPDTAIGMSKEQAIATNSKTVNDVLGQLGTITDPKQFTTITDAMVDQVLAQTTTNKQPISIIMDTASQEKLVGHLEKSLGTVARVGTVDYNPETNKIMVLGADNKPDQVATDKFNKLFSALQSAKGITKDADVDVYGKQIKGLAGQASVTLAQGQGQIVDFTTRIEALEGSTDQSISPDGALGRYQIMPATAARYGYKPEDMKDPAKAKEAATKILTALSHKYSGDWAKVAGAYHSGEGGVDKAIKQAEEQTAKGIKHDWWEYLGPEGRRYVQRAAQMGQTPAQVAKTTPLPPQEQPKGTPLDATVAARETEAAFKLRSLVGQPPSPGVIPFDAKPTSVETAPAPTTKPSAPQRAVTPIEDYPRSGTFFIKEWNNDTKTYTLIDTTSNKEFTLKGAEAEAAFKTKYNVLPKDLPFLTGVDKNYGKRPDGTNKGQGYFGELKIPGSKDVATEYSITLNINGKETLIPTLIPTLTKTEVDKVLEAAASNKQVPKDIVDKAAAFAKLRMKEGKSPFATKDEEGKSTVSEPVNEMKSALADYLQMIEDKQRGDASQFRKQMGGIKGLEAWANMPAKEAEAFAWENINK